MKLAFSPLHVNRFTMPRFASTDEPKAPDQPMSTPATKADTVSITSKKPVELSSLYPRESDIPAEFQLKPYNGGKITLINGELKPWNGATQKVTSPILVRKGTGAAETLEPKVLGELAWMGETDALAALDAAEKAFDDGDGVWPSMTAAQRIKAMNQFIADIKPRRDEVAKLLMYEIGKTWADSSKEFDRTVEYFEDTVKKYEEVLNKRATTTSTGGKLVKETLTPTGINLSMGPFNYPFNETLTTLIPALLVGNPIIAKLPKKGALSLTPLYEAFAKNFPKGAVNFISGEGGTLITPIMKSGKIKSLAFIGSDRVANAILKNNPKPNQMEAVLGLGAKNAAVVLPDANLDESVSKIVKGALNYNGQRCTGLKMIFVPRAKADEFVKKLSAEVEKLKIGMPWEKGVSLTPLPEEGKPEWMEAYVKDAESKGAKVVNTGGGDKAKTMFRPAVLYPVTPDMKIYHEEQFGPVIPVAVYNDIKEVFSWHKNSPFGQQVSIFGEDPNSLQPVIKKLKNFVCRININDQCQRGPDNLPFVGRRDSAKGVLSLEDALYRFTIPDLLVVDDTPANRQKLQQLYF